MPSGFQFFTNTIELAGHIAPVVERKLAFRRWIAVHSARRRTDDVFEAQRVAVFNQLIKLRPELHQRVVRTDAAQARLIHGMAKLGRCFVEVAGSFHVLVPSRAELMQRAIEVLRQ